MAKHKKVDDAFDLLDAIGDDFDISDEDSNHSTPPVSPSSSTTLNVSERQQKGKPQARLTVTKTSPPTPAVESGALTFAQRLAKRRAEREKQDRDEREKSMSPRSTSLTSPVASSIADDETIDGILRDAGIPSSAKSSKAFESNPEVSKQPTATAVSPTPPSFPLRSPRNTHTTSSASRHASASGASWDDGSDSEVEKITRAASESTASSPDFAAVKEAPLPSISAITKQTDTKTVASMGNELVYPDESESDDDEAVHQSEVSSGVTRSTRDKHVVDELLLSSPSIPSVNQPSQVIQSSQVMPTTSVSSAVSIQKPVPLNLAGSTSLNHPVQLLNQASVQSKAVALLSSVSKQFVSRSSDFSVPPRTDPPVDASPLSVSSLPQAASPVYTQPNTYPRTDSQQDIDSQFVMRSQSLSQRLTQHLASRAHQPPSASQPLPPSYSNSQPTTHRPSSMLGSSARMLSHLSLNQSDPSLSSSAATSMVASFPMLSPHSVDNYQHNSHFNSGFNSQFISQSNTAPHIESSPRSFISSPRIPAHDRTDRVDPNQLELSTDMNQLNTEQGYMQDFFDEDSPSSREAMLRHEIETLRRDKTDLESRLSMYAQALKLGGGMAAHDVMSLAQGKIQTQSDIIQQLVEENARLRATVWHGPDNGNNGSAETNGYHNASFDKVLLLRLASTLNQPAESMKDSIQHIVEDSMLEETQVIVLLLKEVQDLYRQQKDNNTNDVWQLKNQLRSMRELLDQSLIDKALLADSLAKKTAKMTAIEYEKERLSVLQVMDRRAQHVDPRSRLNQSISSVHSSISIPRKDIYQLPTQPTAAAPAPVRFDADSIYASTRGRKVRASTGIPHEPKVASGKGYRDASAPLRTLSDTKPWGSTSHFFRQVEHSNSPQNFHG